jgi:uncharacterized protein (DUF1800 family)
MRSASLPSRHRRTTLQALLAWAAWSSGVVPAAVAQTRRPGPDAPSADAWRALSRVGYGPTSRLAQQVYDRPTARAWALARIDAAHAASRTAPRIPSALAGINASLPELFEGARKEREARRQMKADAGADNAAQMTPRAGFLADDQDPMYFNRAMVQKAAGWRLVSASQPELEDPLLARLTEFWFNHFNVYAGKAPVRAFVGHYVLNVARAHALGRFEDLVLASARHPAMLFYLDQFQSVADGSPGRDGKTRGLNENYGRELMELHTLGVDGGYQQSDVRDLARVLTGWTIAPQDASGFRFVPRLHDNGRKTILGQSFPQGLLGGGEREGEDAIRMLARHPATARRVCTRLARYFVADRPSAALVQALSARFLATQGDLRQVMRALLESPDFWAAENRLFKTPLDFAVSALVAIQNGAPDAPDGMLDRRRIGLTLAYLAGVGQPMHGWQTPDGYGFDAATWMVPEALTRRADFALALARQAPEPAFLAAYLGPGTLEAIDKEPPALRAGLMLASPEFMYK